MKTFSPFGKGYKSLWWRPATLASLERYSKPNPFPMKLYSGTCGCDNCRMERRKAENFPEIMEAAE